MSIKNRENSPKSRTSPIAKLQDRYRRDIRRRNPPTAELYTHPNYVPQLRKIISAKMEEFRVARTEALEAIDQRIHELAHLKHKMDPTVATELMVTLAEARSILLSLNPTVAQSRETLADVSDRLQAFIHRRNNRTD